MFFVIYLSETIEEIFFHIIMIVFVSYQLQVVSKNCAKS